MDETTELSIGDRVEIGGRTMLRPGFSLVGLTGIIFPSAPNAPAGCFTVAVDWVAHGYTAEAGYPDGTLPLFVNVPVPHLTPAAAPEEVVEQPKPKFKPRNELRPETLVDPEPEAKPEPKPEPKTPEDDEGDSPRPRLRLV
jgi:hypothetical protein